MINEKYKHQAKKIKKYRGNKELIQISISFMSKDHDLVERLKKVAGNTNLVRLRNLLDRWEDR
jgi:hypothetical protein